MTSTGGCAVGRFSPLPTSLVSSWRGGNENRDQYKNSTTKRPENTDGANCLSRSTIVVFFCGAVLDPAG
jgi:hypothetical protein